MHCYIHFLHGSVISKSTKYINFMTMAFRSGSGSLSLSLSGSSSLPGSGSLPLLRNTLATLANTPLTSTPLSNISLTTNASFGNTSLTSTPTPMEIDALAQMPLQIGPPRLGPQPLEMHPEYTSIRIYALLAGYSAAGKRNKLKQAWKRYVLEWEATEDTQTHHRKALEALMCVHIFAGIPKCIEGLHWVRMAEQEFFTPKAGESEQTVRKRKENKEALWKRAISEDDWILPGQDQEVRQKRGDIVLEKIYDVPKLKEAMVANHPMLWQYIREAVYGTQLSRKILTIQEIECVSMACLVGVDAPRQLYSHVRGAHLNQVEYDLVMLILSDLRLVYHPEAIEKGIRIVNKIYGVEDPELVDDDGDQDKNKKSKQSDKQKPQQPQANRAEVLDAEDHEAEQIARNAMNNIKRLRDSLQEQEQILHDHGGGNVSASSKEFAQVAERLSRNAAVEAYEQPLPSKL